MSQINPFENHNKDEEKLLDSCVAYIKKLEERVRELEAQAKPEVVVMLQSNISNLEQVVDSLLEREKLLMDSIAKKDAALKAYVEALEVAKYGLQWYRAAYRDQVDGSDYEAAHNIKEQQ